MKRSLTEIEAMVLKAGRGAGLPLGHAEDLARAGRFLAATAPQQIAELTLALDGHHELAQVSDSTILSARAAMAGPMALDLLVCGAARITLKDLDAPAVVSAMLALACRERGLCAVLTAEGDHHIIEKAKTPPVAPKNEPVDVPDAVWQAWDRLAANTYVPATEASRLAGAGAGLTDND